MRRGALALRAIRRRWPTPTCSKARRRLSRESSTYYVMDAVGRFERKTTVYRGEMRCDARYTLFCHEGTTPSIPPTAQVVGGQGCETLGRRRVGQPTALQLFLPVR